MLALIGAVAVIAFGFATWWAQGSIYSSAEAIQLINALSNSALYLASAIAASSATTLALMLTMVGLVKRVDHDFDRSVYSGVALISRLSAINLIGSVFLFLLLSMPIGEFDNLPPGWFSISYNVMFTMTVALSSLSVAIILLLLQTITTLVTRITPSDDV